jgi:NADH-quinone oxidoreductase subunit E
MAGRQLAKQQPEKFAFSAESIEKANKIIANYPAGRQASAVISLLYLAQKQHDGWLPVKAMEAVAEKLNMPYIRVFEVATFYTMFNLAPVGENFIQVCRTTPCWLRGSDQLTAKCKSKLGVESGHVTKDGKFSYIEVECLGACVNAPMIQINDDYYEDLTPESLDKLLDDLASGKKPKTGTQINRINSAPEGGLTSLNEK